MDFLKELPSKVINNGIQYIYKAANNYGASIVRHSFSYGNKKGLWELAVTKYDSDDNWDLCYDTPITSDVLGWLTEQEVNDLLVKISEL